MLLSVTTERPFYLMLKFCIFIDYDLSISRQMYHSINSINSDICKILKFVNLSSLKLLSFYLISLFCTNYIIVNLCWRMCPKINLEACKRSNQNKQPAWFWTREKKHDSTAPLLQELHWLQIKKGIAIKFEQILCAAQVILEISW